MANLTLSLLILFIYFVVVVFQYCFKFIYFYFWLLWVFVAARRLFSGCGKRGLFFIAVCGLLTVVASLVAEHRL